MESMQRVIEGDSQEVLALYPDSCFHAVVTDPPWAVGKGFMGKDWDKKLPAQGVWDETYRVLKPGGHAWVMSSERPGCFVGLYTSLHRAGFQVDDTQIVNWVALTGMPKGVDVGKQADREAFDAWLKHVGREAANCPDHKQERHEDGRPKRCASCEKLFAEGWLTHEDKRKAESAALNGEHPSMPGGKSAVVYSESRAGRLDPQASKARHEEGAVLLSRLVAAHWPAGAPERQGQWTAVVGEVPKGWDTSRPPGARLKTGERKLWGYARHITSGRLHANSPDDGEVRDVVSDTAPSTPLATEWDGWRGSVAPLKPFSCPILHAVKPKHGSYLHNAREHGVGPLHTELCAIPVGEGGGYPVNVLEEWSGLGQLKRPAYRTRQETRARAPSNLLSYGDLLGELQKHADLDAWAEALGLPTASAELLEAGIVYARKPSRKEKNVGLPANEGVSGYNRKCGICGKWERAQGLDPERYTCRCPSPEWIEPTGNTCPTVKPIALCAYLIALSMREEQCVLDPFVGSGATLLAAKHLGVDGVGIDSDPEAVAVTTARLRGVGAKSEL